MVRYTPFYRLYLLTHVILNILTPYSFVYLIIYSLYLSCPEAWNQKNGQPSSTLLQLVSSELAALQQRLNTGENPTCSK